MRVLVTGAAGMIGRKLVARLIGDGSVAGRAIEALDLHDIVEAAPAETPFEVAIHVGDIADPATSAALIARRPDVIFHLASVVSGEAESDLELCYRVNLDGARSLFEAIRAQGDYCPRVVFTSSIAVFGGPFPEIIPDDFHTVPLSSYGAQKVMIEAMLVDYTRRGIMDGVGIRLPSICVRPGKPNKAASGFFSGIIREPLAGIEAKLPVPRSVVNTHASPRAAVGFLIHGAGLDGAAIGPRRNLNMPGVVATIGEQIEARERGAGAKVAGLVRDVPDATIWAMVKHWPTRFAATRARELGFAAEASFDEIIQVYLEDDLGRPVTP
jgi:D-erythronate 2-dehydrogenase